MPTDAPPCFVFAGGGTGGHLFPGIAAAVALRNLRPGCEVLFFTSQRPIDAQIFAPTGFRRIPQPVQAWPARPTQWYAFFRNYRASVALVRGHFDARRPAVVLSLGGFAGAPAVAAARKCGVPTALFNPDATPGRANRRLIRKVDRVFVQWDQTFEAMGRAAHVRVTGCPVRPEFLATTREQGCRAFQLDPARHVLLITGASQGAATINEAAAALAPFFAEYSDWQILHLAGPRGVDALQSAYRDARVSARVLDFTPHMAAAMAASDLVLCRAGASTLAELSAVGRPAVLLPYPFDRARHQMANARVLAEPGAAMIIEDQKDAEANARMLRPVLKDLMTSHERRRRMGRAARVVGRADAADAMAAELLALAALDEAAVH